MVEVPIDELQRVVAMKKIAKKKIEFFKYHHQSTTGNRMSWVNYPYLIQIYKDISPEVVVMSSVQTGKSEDSLIHAFASLDYGLSVFHVFSTDMAKNSFIKSRVEDLCDKVQVYNDMENDVIRNKYLKSMGKAGWKFAISSARNNFDEFPADMVIVDELDSCDPENVKLADGRMENSPYKFKRIIGNPTVKNRGTSELFDKSTQHEWYFRCDGCNEHFKSDFFEVVVNEIRDDKGNHLRYELFDKDWTPSSDRDIHMQCPLCGHMQDRNKWKRENKKAKYSGKWIATAPDAKWTGYHISQLMKLNSKISALWEQLCDAEGNDFKMQVFFNRLIGLPYEGTGSKITLEMLRACSLGYTEMKSGQTHGKAVAGVDVGKYLDMQIDLPVRLKGQRHKKRMFLHACRCESLAEVKEKCREFNVGTLYIDAQPEYNAVKEFQESMYGKTDVWRVQITKARTGNMKLHGFKMDEEECTITVDRDWLLEEGCRAIRERIDIIPEHFTSIQNGFWSQSLCSITREFDNQEGQFHWSKAEGLDHFRFAHAFSFLAFIDSRSPVSVDDIGLLIGLKPEKDETVEERVRNDIKRNEAENRSILQQEIGITQRRMGIKSLRRNK